jgi:glutathione synthase/RimK-type ligase-like ATP-grasp enzyme
MLPDVTPDKELGRQLIIAIQPDYGGPENSSSPRWKQLITGSGHLVRDVNVLSADIFEQLRDADGFMWRCAHYPSQLQVARRLLPVLEHELGLEVYPNERTFRHFDDKIAQYYLLRAHRLPTPQTWVWFDRDLALDWARTIEYPVVLKLHSGAGSCNVRLVKSFREAHRWITRLFGRGLRVIDEVDHKTRDLIRRAQMTLRYLARHRLPHYMSADLWERHKDYVLFQEFLPDNAFDTRVTVVGNRAFAFRRFNRPNDFRASGSGRIDYDQAQVAPEFISLAFEVAQKLGTQSCAIDGLRRGGEPVIGEVSYAYVSSAVHACPGHWSPTLEWQEGQMWPEEAQTADFLQRLRQRRVGIEGRRVR